MKKRSFDVLSVGSGTLDIFMNSDKFKVLQSKDIEGGVAMCEVYGGKMEVEDVVITSGGGGTNTAVSFAKKDLKTVCVVEMGKDPAAEIIKRGLKKTGVDTGFLIEEEDEVTAVSVILVAKEGGRSVIVYRGASAMLDRKDFPFGDLKTRWMHVSSMGGRVKLLGKMLKWAKRRKVRVSLNPGSGEIQKRENLLKLLSLVEILFLNKEEAERLFGVKLDEKEGWDKIKTFGDGAFVTVVTAGEEGGRFLQDGKWESFEGKKVKKIVDSTGAGDAFASGMVAGVLYGFSYREALEWGVKNAVGVIKKVGAKPGLLSLAEIK